MKKIFFIVLIALLLMAFGLNMAMVFPKISTEEYISPNEAAIFMNTEIYFVDEESLKTESRRIEVINTNYEMAVLDALIDGPKNIKYDSLLHFSSDIISVDYANNTCYVNLSKEVLSSDEWQSDRLNLYLWSIVNSLTEIKRVFKVQFLVDGERINQNVMGYSLDEPLSRLESLNYAKERMPADAVVDFVDNITSMRYDLAYELLTEESQLIYDFNDFVMYASSLSDETEGFVRDMYFTKTYSDHWIIYLQFVKNVEDKDLRQHFFKNWQVVEESDNYHIDLLNN